MPGAFQDLANDSKNIYPAKALEAMLNEETPFRRWVNTGLPAGSRVTEGIVKIGAFFSPPQNVGQHVDGDDLPTPKDRTSDQFTFKPTTFSGTFQIGWQTQSALGTNRSAFNGGEIRRRTEETITDLGKYIEQTYAATHGSGRRARVLADGASSTFTVDKPERATLLRENFKISVRTTDGGDAVRDSLDNRTIEGIDHSTDTVTYSDTDQTVVAGDHVHVVTKASQTSLNSVSSATPGASAFGLRGLIDDGTYATFVMGLSRNTYSKLKSIVKDNGGTLRNLSEQILVNTCHEVRHRSGKRITDAWMGTGQAEKYLEFTTPDRRFPQPGRSITPRATGYQEDTMVHAAPGAVFNLNVCVDIMPREIYLLNRGTFFHYLARSMDWWDEGSMLKAVPTDGGFKSAWFACVYAIENLGCDMPLGNAVIRDLRDSFGGDA